MLLDVLKTLFGGGSAIKDVAEVFRPNAEAADQRQADYQSAALAQFGAEFNGQAGWFNRMVNGLNRLPRPMLALGTLFLLVSAMIDPIWFASRMQGLALVPEPLWWLLGAIVAFYFGGRYQIKGQDFQRSIAATVAMAPTVARNIQTLRELRADSPGVADVEGDEDDQAPNPALDDWKANARAD